MEFPRRAQVHIPSPRCDLSDSDERLAPVIIARSRSQTKSITEVVRSGKRKEGKATHKVTELETESVWPDLETYLKPQETRKQVWGSLLYTAPKAPIFALKEQKRKEYLPWLSLHKESPFPAKSRLSPCRPVLLPEISTPSNRKPLCRSPLPAFHYLTRKQLHREPTIWKSPLGHYEYVDGGRKKGRNRSYCL